MLIQVDGVPRPILLTGCDTLLPVLARVMGSWRFRPVETNSAAPVISVRRINRRYRIDSPWLEEPAEDDTEVGAVCCLAIDLVQAYVEHDPSLLCLHCAAVAIDGRLVVFPSTVRAGKSMLVARLASKGHRIYADDVLPIAAPEEKGLALGLAPRLRRPLPSSIGTELRAFVDAHRGPEDNRYLYLSLTAAMLAQHGSTAPIGAFVLLDRRPSVRAQLVPIARGSGLQQLIAQNFAQGGASIGSVERLAALVECLPCVTLVYSDLDEASALLQDRFSGWNFRSESARARSQSVPADASEPEQHEPESNDVRGYGADKSCARRVRQAPGVYLKRVDGDLFLIRHEQDGVFHLNPIAAALWCLLEHPATIEEAVSVLHDAFPEADPRQIKRDVRSLFDRLHRARLIRNCRVAR